MRQRGRTDATQSEIVKGLRSIPGCTVAITSNMGDGFPDLLVGLRARNYLLECKSGKSRIPEKVLTLDQIRFISRWNTPIYIVWSLSGALYALGLTADGHEDCVVMHQDLNYSANCR